VVVLLLLPLLMLLDVQLHLLSAPLLMSSQTVGHVARGPPRQQIGYGHIRHPGRLSHRPQVVLQTGRRDFGRPMGDRMSQGIVNKTEVMKDRAQRMTIKKLAAK